MSVYAPQEPPRLGLAMWKKFAVGAIIIIVLVAAPVATVLLLQVHTAINDFQKESIPIPGIKNVLQDVAAGAPETILVLGSDHRFRDGSADPGRSDTIMVVRLDPDKHATAIMSIPRDLIVDIPGVGRTKINAAYANGGPKLAVRTVRALLGIPINHVVNVNFGGFQRAVNRLGCVYADIDRRYFNDNNPPVASAGNYATIDLKPGYQKLCGSDALDYVRFRHLDSDFVRAARQQDFLRQAKEQIGLGKLFGDRAQLLKIFGRYTQTDIARDNDVAILRLIKLAYESSKTPIQQVKFLYSSTGADVRISPGNLAQTVNNFIAVKASGGGSGGGATGDAGAITSGKKHKHKVRKLKTSPGLAPGLINDAHQGESAVLAIATRLPTLPVYYPGAILGRGGYVIQTKQSDPIPRSYDIFDRNKNRYRAYRIVLSSGETGQYYGVQGTTWPSPPILDNPTDTVSLGGRKFSRFFDGHRIRLISWRTPHGVYWVTNTLLETLTNKQMMGIARSLKRVGT